MKKILIGLLLAFTFFAHGQNIEIKLIYSRVILKNGEINYFGNDSKYYGNTTSEGIRYTMGGAKLDSLAKYSYYAALNGKIIAYDPFAVQIKGHQVSFPVVLSMAEIASIGSSSDTGFTKVFNPADIVAIDFYETWTINSKTLDIKKKIIAICPVMAVYRYDEFLGLLPMFWIKM